MALSNSERQKRWREKNREIRNLRRRLEAKRDREFRKTNASIPDEACGIIPEESPERPSIEELRKLMNREHEKIVEEPVKPLVFRNDYGNVITERAWNILQKKKDDAKKGGYELDDYSQ